LGTKSSTNELLENISYPNHNKIEHKILKVKTIKLIEEDIGVNICNLRFGYGFLDITTKAQETRQKKR
jgi:hypothetical protein